MSNKPATVAQPGTSLYGIAKLFFKLGVLGFGGPAVHIAMMEEEVVRKRAWMNHQHFLDLVGATNLIPGPNSTEMTMHIGRERTGWRGLVVAGCCFIFPAVLITALFAWAYQQYGHLPRVQPFIYGIKPAIIAVIVVTMISLGRKALKSMQLVVIGLLSALAALAGVNEIIVLFGAGLTGVFLYVMQTARKVTYGFFPFTLLQMAVAGFDGSAAKLFFVFLKVGSLLYGSGYVLFAFSGCRTGWQGMAYQTTTGRCYRCRSVHTRAGVFISYVYWLANRRGGRCCCCYHWNLSSFICICGPAESIDTKTSQI